MPECLPWLRQGDVFADAPICVPAIGHDGVASVPPRRGVALLITQNCQLDKRTNSNRPRAGQRFQFLPLADVSELGHDRMQRLLNRDEGTAPEAIYVGRVEDVELCGLLGMAYSLPAEDFGAMPLDFDGNLYLEPDDDNTWRMSVRDIDWPRIMSMEQRDIDIMHRKMVLFWTGLEVGEIIDS